MGERLATVWRAMWSTSDLGPKAPTHSGSRRVLRRFDALRTHSSHGADQSVARHPQIAQGEQRVQLGGVLRQSALADLHVPELALDHPKRMFHLGTDARLDVLELFGDGDMPLAVDGLRVVARTDRGFRCCGIRG